MKSFRNINNFGNNFFNVLWFSFLNLKILSYYSLNIIESIVLILIKFDGQHSGRCQILKTWIDACICWKEFNVQVIVLSQFKICQTYARYFRDSNKIFVHIPSLWICVNFNAECSNYSNFWYIRIWISHNIVSYSITCVTKLLKGSAMGTTIKMINLTVKENFDLLAKFWFHIFITILNFYWKIIYDSNFQ